MDESKPLPNPRADVKVRWFKPATYLDGVIVCPLCHLPETTSVYRVECHCWDDREGTR